MADAPPPDAPAPDDRYPGEGCVSVWLKFLILANVVSMLLAPWVIGLQQFRDVVPNVKDWMVLPFILSSILNIVFLIALLGRRMWGYAGLWVVGLLGVALHIAAGMRVVQAVSSLTGLVLLYWVLQIGGDRSGWSRLK